MKYRIFENDVGLGKYSCWTLADGENAEEALNTKHLVGVFCLAIADTREALEAYGPHHTTGALPAERVLKKGRDRGLLFGPKRFRQ